jgi:hypothetical protein
MCRITAVVRKNYEGNLYSLPDMLIDILLNLSEKQHRDGFGMFLAGNNTIYKKAEPCNKVVNTPDFVQWLSENSVDNGPILAHVRQSTFAKAWNAPDSTAHPFQSGNLTLVHNGHLVNALTVRDKYKIPLTVVVDSEIFLEVLRIKSNGNPLDLKVIQETVNEFIGPFVIFVHEDIPERADGFWILMGKDRSMHYYETDNSYIFCTENGIVDIINRNLARESSLTGRDYHPISKVFKLDQDHLYRAEFSGVFKHGELKSVAEVEKPAPKVIAPAVFGEKQTSAMVAVEEVSVRSLCARVNKRLEILVKFDFLENELDDFLECLSPLLPNDSYLLNLEELKLFEGFLITLENNNKFNFVSADNVKKREIWDKISEIDEKPEMACSVLSRTFESPYLINSVQVLQECMNLLYAEEEPA